MASEPAPISDAARHALRQELADLHEERATVAATLTGTDEVGDRADAADELRRADELGRLDDRIDQVTGQLRQAAAAGPPATELVGPGSTLTVRFADGTLRTLHIGETADASDQELVTSDSPLGRALLGHRAGDTVRYQAPGGQTSATVLSLGGPPGGRD